MNRLFSLLLLALPTVGLNAQCFKAVLAKGDQQFEQGKFSQARSTWELGRDCPDFDAAVLKKRLWKLADDDGDGKVNGKDACPNQPAQTANGCPPAKPKDSDRDGVPDKDDRCIDEPGLKKLEGCPDSDGDDVPDIDDNCPSTPGLLTLKGCPPPRDTDGDGIPDRDDFCTNEKGDSINYGCPFQWGQCLALVKSGKEPNLKLMQTALSGFQIDQKSLPNGSEAIAMLAWLGCTGIKGSADNKFFWGKLPGNSYEIRFWVGTYEKNECYGIRFQTATLQSYIQSNESYFELCKDKSLIGCEFCPEMILVTGGAFQMGSKEYRDAIPKHFVVVSDFYIGKYEVTQAEWKSAMGSNPSAFKDCDQCPVEQVSWDDVQEFLKKLNEKTGKKFRLPTEAEWEFAARGGNFSASYEYSGGNKSDNVAWYNNNSGNKTHPVGSKEDNELGIFDMSGNVWEWCQDAWHDDYSGAPSNGSAWSSGGDQSSRVLRGGSWQYTPDACQPTNRIGNTIGRRDSSFGFRVAQDK